MQKISLISGIVTAAILLSAPVYAQDDPVSSKADVPMVSGGVGEELDYLKSVEHQYNLKLLFTEANGMYLAEMPVTITDGQGNIVVNTVTKGPFFLLTLPPGSYKVTATNAGETKEKKVNVSSKMLHEYIFRFPTRDTVTSGDHAQ